MNSSTILTPHIWRSSSFILIKFHGHYTWNDNETSTGFQPTNYSPMNACVIIYLPWWIICQNNYNQRLIRIPWLVLPTAIMAFLGTYPMDHVLCTVHKLASTVLFTNRDSTNQYIILIWISDYTSMKNVCLRDSGGLAREEERAWWRHQMKTFFRVTGPLCEEFTGHRWIPHPKASHAELWCFRWPVPWRNGWVNNREYGDLKRHRAYYDVMVMDRPITT